MKINKLITVCFVLFIMSCSKVLDLEPTNKIPADAIFGDPAGVQVYMANLYYQLPIEDFTFFRNGFRWNGGPGKDPNNGGFAMAMQTDEAAHSEFGDFMRNEDFGWWEEGYKLIRDVNLLIDAVPTLEIEEGDKNALVGEGAFIKAYAYYALAKRYGGVPLLKQSQEYDIDPEKLKVPRSTEKETWDYVMELCDIAITNLGSAKG
ncbi:MAG TPA: RagB/SusD family nutrient uptake outer membrane protein, partial [Chryseolinea sp.]|nr:RagB/SusD family nutrient uptake outer membrane protein [Chryseolinea sp.]